MAEIMQVVIARNDAHKPIKAVRSRLKKTVVSCYEGQGAVWQDNPNFTTGSKQSIWISTRRKFNPGLFMPKSSPATQSKTQEQAAIPRIRVTPDIKSQIEQKALQCRQSLSEYMINCALSRPAPVAIPEINVDAYAQLVQLVMTFKSIESTLKLLQQEFFNHQDDQQAVFNSLVDMLHRYQDLSKVIASDLICLENNHDEEQYREPDPSFNPDDLELYN